MNDAVRDYSETLFLPKTDFPMRAGLPKKEPELLARWQRLGLYRRLREAAKDRPRFILHDGPPYANANIHIGHALNKILKDLVDPVEADGWVIDSNYVPGWDCHGLPIEWKIEEEKYRARGKNKPDLSDAGSTMVAFRRECREYRRALDQASRRRNSSRLGVEGNFAEPYTTMSLSMPRRQIARRDS